MPKTDFDKLLHRYLTGRVTDEEKKKLEAWLEIKKTDASIPDELTPGQEEILFQKITGVMKTDEASSLHDRAIDEHHQKFIYAGRALRIAASIALIVLTAFGVYLYNVRETTLFYTDTDVVKRIFHDGTIVWLEPGSTITYAYSDSEGTRNATLVGGGLFEVAKDPDHPFIIRTHGVTVRVLGTSFRITPNDDGIALKVLTGKVNLSSAADTRGTDVPALESVVYKASGEQMREKLTAEEVDRSIGNTSYRMNFDDQHMSDVLKRIALKFDIIIELENQDMNRCRITADFTDRSLSTTLTMLEALLDLRFSIDGKTVKISGAGCPVLNKP